MKIPLVKTITEGLGLAAGHEAAGVGANALQKGLEQLNEAVLPSVKPKFPALNETTGFNIKEEGTLWGGSSYAYKHPNGTVIFDFNEKGEPISGYFEDKNGFYSYEPHEINPSDFEAVKAEHNVGKIDPLEQVPWTPKDYYFTEKDEFPDAGSPESGMENPLSEGASLTSVTNYPSAKMVTAKYEAKNGTLFYNYNMETGEPKEVIFIDNKFNNKVYQPGEIAIPSLESVKQTPLYASQSKEKFYPTQGHLPIKKEQGVLTYIINEKGKEHEAGKYVFEYNDDGSPDIAYFYPLDGSEAKALYSDDIIFPFPLGMKFKVGEKTDLISSPPKPYHDEEYGPIPFEETHPIDDEISAKLMALSREESDETHIGFEPSLHEGVTASQDKAVKSYTTSSRNTNRYAAGRDDIDYGVGSEGWLNLVKRTNNLDALTERSIPYDALLFRFVEPNLWAQFRKTPVGLTFTHRAFASSSFKKQEGLASEKGGLLTIIAPKGTKGFVTGPMASKDYWNEQEVILKRSTRFKVIAKEGRNLVVEALPPEPSSWRRPPEESIKHEYDIEYKLHFKPSYGDVFPTFDDFKEAIDKAPIADITKKGDLRIGGRSRTESVDSLLSLIKSYKSYPQFRNEKTLNDLSERIKGGQLTDMPIVIRDRSGSLKILSGNTRMDLAFIHGADRVPVILLEIP